MPMPDSESVFVIPGSVLLWRIAPRPPNSAQVRLGPAEGASRSALRADGALPRRRGAGQPTQRSEACRQKPAEASVGRSPRRLRSRALVPSVALGRGGSRGGLFSKG